MTGKTSLLLPLLLLSLAASGCGDAHVHSEDAAATPEATASDGNTGNAADTGGGAPRPISSRGEPVGGGAAAGGEQPRALDFGFPPGWETQQPASNMRLAQAAIPGPGGPGEIAVFYFGPGSGGSVQDNIQRWIDQMELQGPPPAPQTFESNGLRITWVEAEGTLKPSNMGMGPAEARPGSRLLGAVVEGPGGPWFFKAVGPDATLAAQRESFLAMLREAKLR